MLEPEKIKYYNSHVLELLSGFLTFTPDAVQSADMLEIMESCRVTADYAFAVLLAGACGVDIGDRGAGREFFENYFVPMVRRLDPETYRADPYYHNIRIPNARALRWEMRPERYKSCQAFVRDDMTELPDGRVLPAIGFFECEFEYPAVFEEGREWMTVTPNEVETMKGVIEAASGHVLTFGLGLGYFAYSAARKPDVQSVTVVERDAEAIGLFTAHILPQFPDAGKVRVARSDAFEWARANLPGGGYDFVFTDLWHDVSDGIELYLRMKELEGLSPGSRFMYWIEKTMGIYLRERVKP